VEGKTGIETRTGRSPGLALVGCLVLGIPCAAAAKTVLIFGPHPDDEILIAAGRIHAGVASGDTVKVVVVTNGDFSGLDTGLLREGESVAAAQLLGLTENDVIFLGYPDGSLTELHDAAPGEVVTSAAGQTATYGNRGLGSTDYHRHRYGVPGSYTRTTALGDFVAVLTSFSPDEVFTVSDLDSHPDHQATARFVTEAIASLTASGHPVATALYQTLVWTSGVCEVPDCWPQVAGFTPELPFLRPDSIDPAQWSQRRSFAVPQDMRSSDPAVNLKYRAIGRYESQLTLENGSWFYSFARGDEFFWLTEFCSGSVCNLGLPNGAACTVGGQCASSSCADGVCCNTTCGGQCQVCNLVGSTGTCATVGSGQPQGNRPTCTGVGTTCGGVCDGTDADVCHYPGAVPCRDANCSSGIATAAASCDGAGLCPAAVLVQCAPYVCGTTACRTTCGNDGDCVAADHCSSGSCLPRLDNGTPCAEGDQCASGHCTDGRCCDGICGDQCQACDVAGHLGTCTTLASGQPHGARQACAGSGSICGGTCDGSSATECHYPDTSCRDASCSGEVATAAANCDGAGHCPAMVSVTCTPYACGLATCQTGCTGNESCSAGHYCDAGNCLPLGAQGTSCHLHGECASGHCTDSYCCDGACDGQCQACDLPGHLGVCSPTEGIPHGIRLACSGTGTICGGACDGSNAATCRYPDSATPCRTASCSEGVATTTASCDGDGACPAALAADCAPYACGPVACLNSCVADSDCSSGYSCAERSCQVAPPPEGGQRGSGGCSGGGLPGVWGLTTLALGLRRYRPRVRERQVTGT
jgi:LmbE family N-acetylglucosaminyl deacetylase